MPSCPGGWNGTWTQSGSAVTVTDAGWNGTIAPGAQVTLGFNGTWAGSNAVPAAFTVNGVKCDGSPSPSPSVSRGAENCTDYAALVRGKYWVNNNVWGKADGTGSQCVSENGLSGDSLSWGTSWTWSGDTTKVKSYASAVLGWHWGWKSAGTGLPIRLSDGKAVNTNWNFQVTQATGNIMNVAYDLWLHDIANPDWQHNPTDEVMVWLYRSGGAGPVGTKQATVTIAGTTWDLYKGNIGWNVYSFVRTSNTSSAALDLTGFTDDLVARGWLTTNKYLSSVQAGPEIFTGSGRLDTTAYSVKIG